jgi:hypothetical protein
MHLQLGRLSENRLHEISMDIGQAVIAALEPEGQSGVIKAQQMEYRRV